MHVADLGSNIRKKLRTKPGDQPGAPGCYRAGASCFSLTDSSQHREIPWLSNALHAESGLSLFHFQHQALQILGLRNDSAPPDDPVLPHVSASNRTRRCASAAAAATTASKSASDT